MNRLWEIFERAGDIAHIRVLPPRDPLTEQHCAFVNYMDHVSSQRAVDKLNGFMWEGALRVKLCLEQENPKMGKTRFVLTREERLHKLNKPADAPKHDRLDGGVAAQNGSENRKRKADDSGDALGTKLQRTMSPPRESAAASEWKPGSEFTQTFSLKSAKPVFRIKHVAGNEGLWRMVQTGSTPIKMARKIHFAVMENDWTKAMSLSSETWALAIAKSDGPDSDEAFQSLVQYWRDGSRSGVCDIGDKWLCLCPSKCSDPIAERVMTRVGWEFTKDSDWVALVIIPMNN